MENLGLKELWASQYHENYFRLHPVGFRAPPHGIWSRYDHRFLIY